jgi:hypothetical protein
LILGAIERKSQMDDVDIPLKLYDGQSATARHVEVQRSTLANFIVAIASAALGYLGLCNFELHTWPVAVLIVLFGVYGWVAAMKLYERARCHGDRARAIRDHLDTVAPNARIGELRKAADERHKKDFPFLYLKIRLYWIWSFLQLAIVVLGLSSLALILWVGRLAPLR